MDARELRIGNLVQINNKDYRPEDTGKIATVYSVVEKGTYGYSIGCKISEYESFGQLEKHIEPVMLTEEWLLKFGFEKDWFGYSKGEALNTAVMFDDSTGKFSLTTSFGEYEDCEIKHVHHLQNIYFVLEGKELELTQRL